MDKSVRGKRRRHFFEWCEKAGLVNNGEISRAFSISTQTVRNWRRNSSRNLKDWVWLAVEGYEVCMQAMNSWGKALPGLPRVTVGWFSEWMTRNFFRTYEEAGLALGLTRQAVHNWYRRNRFPNWLALACVGVEGRRRRLSKREVVSTVWSLQPGNMAGR
jgi:hypothetical protein